jgi:sulfide:quinone oxidoreductase
MSGLRKRGFRDRSSIKFLTPYPCSYPVAELSKTVQIEFNKKGIEVVPFFNVDYVDPKGKDD